MADRAERKGSPSPATQEEPDLAPRIAEELRLDPAAVRATVALLDGGATVPFIARYRKEQTKGLDEVAIRAIEEKRDQLRALEERRSTILTTIAEQGKLTPELRAAIQRCRTRAELEDLYLPYRPKRKTRASIARERGLEPLARRILEQPPSGNAASEAARFVDPKKEVGDADAALAGARDIVAEIVAERSDVRALVRARFDREGLVESSAVKSKTKEPTKFEAYYDYSERAKSIPSHRWLAIVRGETEGVLRVKVRVDEEPLAREIAARAGVRRGSPFAAQLEEATADSMKRLLLPSIEGDVRDDLKARSDVAAVGIFAENLGKLLLAAPLGRRIVLGIDPGQRTGCKCVVVDDTGKLQTHTLVNLVTGDAAREHAKRTVLDLVKRFSPFAIAVGNGTHGRETADFCRQVLRDASLGDSVVVVLVSESGASVYSASDVAREELPDVDLTVRGAVSIARRLQDPLAELVKLDPKAIGVGQYQHDVDQTLLVKKLDEVVESCVNAVGVELNTASAPLLAHVAGIGPSLAKKIVAHRQKKGAFRARKELLDVSGLGPKAFEQAAGFVRVRDAANPLDASAVHPERYGLVERIAKDAGVSPSALVGNDTLVAKIPWASYASADVGLPTLEDIRRELSKPGRDPRDAFEPPKFRDDVRTIEDIKPGMVLDGVVTNVTAFGAFVDLGVKQDGLVHVSELADRFVKDPHEVARVGDRVKVRVLGVDLARKRVSLSRRAIQ
ncbi:MAG: RNA-binding transcriptional accessory protein [Myxococcales bacterium 68-20]|nr:MAG: RNA-binding transcriptional accessory protein [Myxococcales bacterium 68-20]